MIVSSSARLTWLFVRNLKDIQICLSNASRRYVVLSPILQRRIPLALCAYLSRVYSSTLISSDDIDNYYEQDDSNVVYQKLTKKENIDRLMNCIGCSESLVASILREFPKFKLISSGEIKNKIEFLNEKGITLQSIVKNYWILTLKTSVIEAKLKLLDTMGINNIALAIPLLRVTHKRLKEVSAWSKSNSAPHDITKIAYLSDKLQCDPADIACAVSVHRFLQNLPFDRMRAIMDILLDAGVPPQYILKDLWVLRYTPAQAEERVKRAKEGGIQQFKPWMVRCTEKSFLNTIRIQAEKHAVLGAHNDSTVSYISSRLGVSPAEAQLILTRHPQLRGVGAAKLCNTLDFLLGKEKANADSGSVNGNEDIAAKFDRSQVWSSSRALCHSLETMKVRLMRLRALGYEPRNPVLLYKSKRKFEEFVKKLEEKQGVSEESVSENIETPIKKAVEEGRTDVNR